MVNKTQTTAVDPAAFIDTVDNPTRRADAHTLLALFNRVTGLNPQMWGPTMIGYGRYHYTYASGREGDAMITGFSPRKSSLVLYVLSGYDGLEDHLARLGKHKHGKSCLYVNKLADIDMAVLEAIIEHGLEHMRATWPTFDH